MSAHAQTIPGRYYLPSSDDEETGAITSEAPPAALPQQGPAGSVPGYDDPYARPARRSDAVESAPISAPVGAPQATYAPQVPYTAQQTPAYNTQQGYAQPSGAQTGSQPMSIAPQGGYATAPAAQGAGQTASYGQPQPGQQQIYIQGPNGGQPVAVAPQGSAPGYNPRTGYMPPQSYEQQQASRGQANPSAGYVVQPQPGSVQAAQGGVQPPAGVYSPNAAVVPGTAEAPSGPRIEDVDPSEPVPDRFRRQTVDYVTSQPAGTIVIDTPNTYLYYVMGGGKAIRYGIGVGRDGFTWAGTEKITRKAEWADWRPPAEMIQRQPYLPRFMAGGPGNPLGARTLYLGGTVYRIHGTNEPQTIGKFVSSGCFRMLNNDVEDLFDRVNVGTKVVILPKSGGAQANAQR
ncbi:L,D-transpeptidase [Azorhizobium doebereinerae]|uniref:L,D-transpeptidase n=1 Tax=Azorhizobium doebereinerae TaxID=281091 RepID=UPI001FD90630|nr:L,D-transpeptidase [Azorhizobium doebereinerae]